MFVDDIMIPGSLYALTIRAPMAKGHLKGLECPALPAGYTLIQGKDIPGRNHLEGFSVPILAAEALSYRGEPVALLVGADMGKLQEYADQCRVVADEDRPRFFEDPSASQEVFAQRTLGTPPSRDTPPPEPHPQRIIQGTYQTGIQEPWYADPQGAVAVYTGEKGMARQWVIHTPTQWPFHVKRSVSQVLQVPVDAVTVEVTALGVHGEGKVWYPSLMACQAALGAYITGKPVKLVLTREEDFRYAPKGHRTAISIQSALGSAGEIRETRITLQADLGAHGVFTDEILDRTCLGSLGAYGIAPVTLDGRALATNIPPQGPFTGFGAAQGFFATERQVSRIADALHQDPATWRKQHIAPKHTSLAIGVPVKAGVVERLMDMTAAKSDYYRKWAAYELLRSRRHGFFQTSWAVKEKSLRGIGIALAYQGSGFLYPPQDGASYGLEVTLEKEGTLEIRIPSCTDGWVHIWRKIAGEILSIEENHIRIHTGTTESVPDSGPISNSRYSAELTPLLETACRAIQKQRFQDPLPITLRQSYQPSFHVPWEGKVSVPLTRLYDEHAFARLGWGVAVVEVAIDPITYTPKIRGIWLGIAGGRILSEKQARLALSTGAIQALGWAAQERLCYTEGKIPEHLFYTLGFPKPEDIPPIQVDFIGQDSGEPKGIGELPFSSIPAAYVQAISQAMDHPFETIPLGAKEIWEVEHQRRKAAAP